MTNSDSAIATETKERARSPEWKWEAAGVVVLCLLAAYLLNLSWRKWADPIVDSGTQWYAFWRLSQGASLYHDILWNYGPLSAYFNASLFRMFGPGMMVLATANLVIYTFIAGLAYIAVRRAWGRLAAFAATAVFICMFSFLHLSAVANYNYVLPYAQESTHGILLILVTLFVAARWRRGPSAGIAFALGLCGGLTAVLKPEFMLAGGVAGIAAFVLRFAERKRVTVKEFAMLAAGLAAPTLIFTAWFARREPVGGAFIDASRAWWMVLVDHSQLGQQQEKFTGLSNARLNLLLQLEQTGKTLVSLALIWAAGWCVNQPLKSVARPALAVGALATLWFLAQVGDWFLRGWCFPLLIAEFAVMLMVRAVWEWKTAGKLQPRTWLALLLVLFAGVMLMRTSLFPPISHLGFFQAVQASLAGMTVAAVPVAVWAAGWPVNPPWEPVVKSVATAGTLAPLWFLTPVGGWYSIGRCFPLLIAALAILLAARAVREWKAAGKLEDRTAMALLLVLAAGTMLARMPLFPRIYHLGFFQAALAGMTLAAAVVAELPRWTGAGVWGRRVATGGALATLAAGCFGITAQSKAIYADMTQRVGSGRDAFYAPAADIDATGAMVNWTVFQFREIAPQATVMVLPEGLMVNYLSRHATPLPTWNNTVPEGTYVQWLQGSAPDYVVLLSRDLSEHRTSRFGEEGTPGHQILTWVYANYREVIHAGGDPLAFKGPKGVIILQKK